jgi:hypothetical protein
MANIKNMIEQERVGIVCGNMEKTVVELQLPNATKKEKKRKRRKN